MFLVRLIFGTLAILLVGVFYKKRKSTTCSPVKSPATIPAKKEDKYDHLGVGAISFHPSWNNERKH